MTDLSVADFGVELASVDRPNITLPRDLPEIPIDVYDSRLAAAMQRAQDLGIDALVVYGDREHFANTSYLTGFDPRYEESILILVPGRRPRLLVGNESVNYANSTVYPTEVIRYSKLSLVGQPDPEDLALADLLADAGLGSPSIKTVGMVGWKYFEGNGAEDYIDSPHYLTREVGALVERVVNASGIFIDPDRGLRFDNEVEQIAYFEFAASHGSQAMIRMLEGIRPGMTELEASGLMNPILMPFNYHPTMLSGYSRAPLGVASPSSRELALGDPVSAGIGYWGSNTARSGFLAASEQDLPANAKDYVEKLIAPYFATAAAWYETVRIGLTAGELYEVTASRIGDPWFGVFLNPGHFIHLDEWPASPVRKGSRTVLRSGNAMQLDIIPATGTEYHTAQIEDGIVLADENLRSRIREVYPQMWDRVQARRAMLADIFGIHIHEDVLPLSNTAGYLPPYWMRPDLAMRKVRA
ncbi:aminopeptidase P family N-terminal domain-containing protein [Microbacterium sp. MPKO10]|uniref:aminopeptidase P family N-terminal domain-containing protein n=1 Tax=Microbacterium sp. MPKO10 TaxID=2989818 RepID=UPI0022367931|nr:aminopeptidase P family N-terminal domain-containing protein [Microbacterium sp. MPKO10]MCW4457868.1 aminopeptidase P family N-terminal domain-containing protein [Microbacterium sp. MPKO10]